MKAMKDMMKFVALKVWARRTGNAGLVEELVSGLGFDVEFALEWVHDMRSLEEKH